ncbi:MAG: hypothetical protein SX243_11665 [Acidobacteriota bacterium]|nr:hypothetical protein [Acidobacteriota bacterium]
MKSQSPLRTHLQVVPLAKESTRRRSWFSRCVLGCGLVIALCFSGTAQAQKSTVAKKLAEKFLEGIGVAVGTIAAERALEELRDASEPAAWPAGAPHPSAPNVVHCAEPGYWCPAPGYRFATQDSGDLSVESFLPDGLSISRSSSVEVGASHLQVRSPPGFHVANDLDPDALSVMTSLLASRQLELKLLYFNDVDLAKVLRGQMPELKENMTFCIVVDAGGKPAVEPDFAKVRSMLRQPLAQVSLENIRDQVNRDLDDLFRQYEGMEETVQINQTVQLGIFADREDRFCSSVLASYAVPEEPAPVLEVSSTCFVPWSGRVLAVSAARIFPGKEEIDFRWTEAQAGNFAAALLTP